MIRTILLLILSFCYFHISAQVGIELDGTVKLNQLDTVSAGAQMNKLVLKEDGTLAIKDAEPTVSAETPQALPLMDGFINSNYFEDSYYYKHNKRVYLGGVVMKPGGIEINDTIAVLPPGYRPAKRLLTSAVSGITAIRLNIESNGVIRALSDGAFTNSSLNGISFPYKYEIGEEIGGGYLFYICEPPQDLNGDGVLDQGLIAAPFVALTGSTWGCTGTSINTEDSIGSGYMNTLTIIEECSDPFTAAKQCNDLVLNGYSDWFLPSKDELELMYTNLADSNGDGANNGSDDPYNIGQFSDGYYWSSSEGTSNLSSSRSFMNGDQAYKWKYQLLLIRAVRILPVE